LTLLLDYRRIWFSETNSVGDPSTLLLAGVPLGATNGPGFGWNDVDAIKAGIEWKYSPDLTLRAGYSYNTQPINSRDVELYILAPAVVQHHITGGFAYRMNNSRWVERGRRCIGAVGNTGTGQSLGAGSNAIQEIAVCRLSTRRHDRRCHGEHQYACATFDSLHR
jgi:hypothetical protein